MIKFQTTARSFTWIMWYFFLSSTILNMKADTSLAGPLRETVAGVISYLPIPSSLGATENPVGVGGAIAGVSERERL